jgi:hypothetical protein
LAPAPPTPAQPAATPEPEPPSETDEPRATLELNDVTISMRVGERPPAADETDPVAYVRVEVAHEGIVAVDAFEREINSDGCLVEELELDIDTIFADGEVVVFDASCRCVLGEVVMRMTIEHTVMATHEHESGLGVLYQGTSYNTNNSGFAVTVDKREFYVEAYKLAVYRHTVAWCDEDGLKELRGDESGCAPVSARKLKLLERVPISVPVRP